MPKESIYGSVEIYPNLLNTLSLVEEKYRLDFRDDGYTPVIEHLVSTARNISEFFDLHEEELILSALLHDIIEDKKLTEVNLRDLYSSDVCDLVVGVSKFKAGDDRITNVREYAKHLLHGGEIDIRVFFLKLADHLHNSQTLKAIKDEDKRIRKAEESLHMYGLGLSEALGMWKVRNIICDNAFEILNPQAYSQISMMMQSDLRLDSDYIANISDKLTETFSQYAPAIKVVPGGIWHIHDKMRRRREANISNIGDVVSYRLVFPDCQNESEKVKFLYEMAGVLHASALGKHLNTSRDNFYVGKNKRDAGYEAIQRTIVSEAGAIEIAFETVSTHERNIWGAIYDYKQGLPQRDIVLLVDDTNRIWFLPPNSTGIDYINRYNPSFLSFEFEIMADGKIIDPSDVLKNGQVVTVTNSNTPRTIPFGGHTLNSVNFRTNAYLLEINRQIDSDAKQHSGYRISRELLTEDKIGVFDFADIPERYLNALLRSFNISYSLLDLYYDLGSGAISKQALSEKLKTANITKEILGFTSIEITGLNNVGIISSVSEIVSARGGDIVTQRSDVFEDNTFLTHLVITGLNADTESNLFNEIKLLPILEGCEVSLI